MKPQSNPVAGFYPINNLRIMPENSNCSSLVDDEVMEGQVPLTLEKVRQMAQSMDNAGLRRSLRRTCVSRKKKRWRTCCATRGAKTDPGGEKPL
jgi:hypothetical protein